MEKFRNTMIELQKEGFKFIIVLLLGITIGVFCTVQFNNKRIDESIQLGGMIHKNVVYNINTKQ